MPTDDDINLRPVEPLGHLPDLLGEDKAGHAVRDNESAVAVDLADECRGLGGVGYGADSVRVRVVHKCIGDQGVEDRLDRRARSVGVEAGLLLDVDELLGRRAKARGTT